MQQFPLDAVGSAGILPAFFQHRETRFVVTSHNCHSERSEESAFFSG
jgi:hypothetical protein